MSDKPLFQQTDAQEAVYAPQQLPDDVRQKQAANADDADRDAVTTDDEVGVPAAGAGLLGLTGGGINSGVVGGAPSAQGTSVGEAAPADETSGDHPV